MGDLRLVLEANPWRLASAGLEGHRQSARDGRSHGWRRADRSSKCPHKAIGSIDDKLVTSAKDFEAINAGIGKTIASVPTSKVMDVYNAFGGLVKPTLMSNYLYASVNPQDAQAAYNALLQFKDVVKGSR